VPEQDRERMRSRIINWSNTEEGKKILKRGELTPFQPVTDRDYDGVRQMGK
jgi:ABC-type phosphate/phosphonate transport system substrate-binding protein